MKFFELAYLGLEPLLPPLHRFVRAELKALARQNGRRPRILDVGGRKSHYTIGLPASIYISDIPRRSSVQEQLHLGFNLDIVRQVKKRRSNLSQVLFDDMTQSSLQNGAFDCLVAVEVLEHVEKDGDFVREVQRVLRPGGTFLMTTPNGDCVANTNPDHKRHYTRLQLETLLRTCFDDVRVEYAIRGGTFRSWGLKSWSPKKPLQTLLSMVGNVVNSVESSGESIRNQANGTRHLMAWARKAPDASK